MRRDETSAASKSPRHGWHPSAPPGIRKRLSSATSGLCSRTRTANSSAIERSEPPVVGGGREGANASASKRVLSVDRLAGLVGPGEPATSGARS